MEALCEVDSLGVNDLDRSGKLVGREAESMKYHNIGQAVVITAPRNNDLSGNSRVKQEVAEALGPHMSKGRVVVRSAVLQIAIGRISSY